MYKVFVYVSGRMGNNKQALQLIIKEEQNVDKVGERYHGVSPARTMRVPLSFPPLLFIVMTFAKEG